MIHRPDVLPPGQAHDSIRQYLLRIGGKNPFGEPIFRLVLAQYVRIFEGGLWTDWQDNASLQDRGGLVMGEEGITPTDNQPIRVVPEMRWTDRYSFNGWILQRWYPAHLYGSPDSWYKERVAGHGHLSCRGPYPQFGDYELCAAKNYKGGSDFGGVTGYDHVPSLTQLENTISLLETRRTETFGIPIAQRQLIRQNEWDEREQKRAAARRQLRIDVIRERLKPYRGSSLAAGRLRTILAERAGIRSHCGN